MKAVGAPEAGISQAAVSGQCASSQDTRELDGSTEIWEAEPWSLKVRRRRRPWRLPVVGIGLVALLAIVLLAFRGLSGGVTEAPPEISYGQDTCVRCGMIIDDPRVAAAYRTATGEARLFDGIDEMVLFYRERHERVAAFHVHDYTSREWLRAEAAFFVVGTRAGPSMGASVVAARTDAEAGALATRLGGRVVTFASLLEGEAVPLGGGHVGH